MVSGGFYCRWELFEETLKVGPSLLVRTEGGEGLIFMKGRFQFLALAIVGWFELDKLSTGWALIGIWRNFLEP